MRTRTSGKRLLLGASIAVAAWLGIEVVSILGLAWIGSSFTETRSERARRAGGQAGDTGPDTENLLAELGPAETEANREVVHPFLGYVFNPELNELERRREQGALEITDEGFFRPPGPPIEGEPGAVRVVMFGGSVAMILSFEGRDRLLSELGRSPMYAGRTLELTSYALGGYKQPQQLATLTYLLATDRRPDLVINLDGFNEVVLPATENAPQGVALAYPRGWPQRIAGLGDADLVRQVGRLALLREARGRWARLLSRRPFRWSPTVNLAWRAGDRRLAASIGAAEAGLARRSPADAGYAGHGPFVAPAGDADLYRRLADLWFAGSLQMHRLCEANGIPYVHFLQPNQYVPGAKRMGAEERAVAFAEDHPYREPVVEGYPYLVAAGRELIRRGVAFHDLTRIFEDVDEPLYFDTCCHLNREGSERLAAGMGAAIVADLASRPDRVPAAR